MENIYLLSNHNICEKIGQRLRNVRLSMDMSQKTLAQKANISLSSVIKMESGDIKSFDAFIRVLRILRELDTLSPLVNEADTELNEYERLVYNTPHKTRKRASKTK